MEELWQQQLRQSLTSPEDLGGRFDVDVEALRPVAQRYPMRITPHYLSLIEEPGDPLWRQCVPDPRELDDNGQSDDPLAEDDLSPVPALVHRYPDRALLLAAGTCAVYCRFCTRKRRVGCPQRSVSFGDVMEGIRYVAETPAVRDVIVSGGEPLLMSDALLGEILDRLRRVSHVEIIRLGTRAPVVLPARITENLCRLLARVQPLYLNTHFNHPREITPEAAQACARLVEAGIVLGNQTVLLKGINDDPAVMAELMRALLRIRVRPYYLHHMDLTRGTGHFRTRLEDGLQIMEQLRGPLSGLGVPQYVVDLPGGRGKVPVLPEYLQSLGERACLRTPEGDLVTIPNG